MDLPPLQRRRRRREGRCHSCRAVERDGSGPPAVLRARRKLIQYHGWNDQQISPFNSINYYKSVEAKLGGHEEVSKSYRLFMAPGMMHCGGGDGPNQFDPMRALERWREQNIAPNDIVAAHATTGVVDTTRPLCPYPQLRSTADMAARTTRRTSRARRRSGAQRP
jgi:hypothetical protein